MSAEIKWPGLNAAAPALIAAARHALLAMRPQLEGLIEIGCEAGDDGVPDRETLDPELEREVRQLEVAIEMTEAAIAIAEQPPAKHLTAEEYVNGRW